MHVRDIPLPENWPPLVRTAMLHVISLAHWGVICTRSWCADSPLARVRLAGELASAKQRIAQLEEEIRIKDERMARIPPNRRPRYSPPGRMSILELRGACGWSLAETARRFLVDEHTISSWTRRLTDPDDGLVGIPQPANKLPDFARYVTQRLKTLCPTMGKKRIAQFLARAGLLLSTTSVGRILRDAPSRPPEPDGTDEVPTSVRVVTADYPNHVWNVDLTLVPASRGFWTTWLPFALPQCWPFAWWAAVVLDHFSRRVVGFAVFKGQPSTAQVQALLDRAMALVGGTPRYIVCDRGRQFDCPSFREWCKAKGIGIRYGAVGQYGSIAVIERFFCSMKAECTRRILVSMELAKIRRELTLYVVRHNVYRCHQGLGGHRPQEVYDRPRTRGADPATGPARPPPVALEVSFLEGRRHLPIIELEPAA